MAASLGKKHGNEGNYTKGSREENAHAYFDL